MKITLGSVILLLMVQVSLGQGTLNFSNGASGVNAPLTYNGIRVGSDFVADLYYGRAGTTDATTLIPLGANVFFSDGPNAGYFFGGARAVSGFPEGQTITVQVRVWRAVFGATFEAAAASGADLAWSSLLQVTLGGGSTPPPSLVGLQATWMHSPAPPPVAPEPSTITIGVAAFAVSLVHRRNCARKQLS